MVKDNTMTIFIDSSNLGEIKKYHKLGIIRGVTTNPTILLKEGIEKHKIKDHIKSIADTVNPYPVSAEVTSNVFDDMIKEAIAISKIASNINIKIPIHGPNGELENLEVVKLLTKEGISINVTAMMSAQQCLLAALSGADYVSLFGGRVNNMGYNCIDEIKKIRVLLDSIPELNNTKIIMGSSREVLNIIEWLVVGADIITVSPSLIEGMLVHPYSKETVQMFMEDAKTMGGAWINI